MQQIILASQSPRRKQLMEMAELEFSIIVADVDETNPPGMPGEEVPAFLARKKADAVSHRTPGAIVVSADTIVLLDGMILGKPRDAADAAGILGMLSGRMHRVITGVCIRKDDMEKVFSVTTEVYFRKLSAEQIDHYISRYKPYDKAGAYAIQEWIGATGIEKINGDYYNVMGLPIGDVLHVLKADFGI
ncbi:Maf-like protein [Nemorincola caseinilytica]|uniref:dTTP/UTP pyrophosphatase n=1 Tax=Nemorincola caseinilytica TaxID=2054315 RepID=A0ABP8NA50_9BACT